MRNSKKECFHLFKMIFSLYFDIILGKTLAEMFDTDCSNCSESVAEFVRDDLDTGEVLDSLVDRGGSGVGAGLELGLDVHGLGVWTSHILYGVIWGTARLPEIHIIEILY